MGKEKGYGYLLMANILIKMGFDIVKEDNNIFKHKTKQVFNHLMDILAPQMYQVERIRKLLFSKNEIEKMNIEQEDVEIEMNEEQELFSNFLNIYFSLSPTGLYDFNRLLINFKEGQRLYTQIEVNNMIENELKKFEG